MKLFFKVCIFLLINCYVLGIDFEFNLNIRYYKNNFPELNYTEYTREATMMEAGYTNFLLYAKEYDEEKSIMSININNLEEENDLKYLLEIELYENFSNHLYKQNNGKFFPDLDLKNYDQSFPYKAYIEYKNFKFGRDKLSWGPGKTGNLILSDFSKYFDHFKFDYQYKSLQYKYVAASIKPYLTLDEYEKIALENDAEDIYNERTKIFVGHRLELDLLENITLALSETQIIGGKSPDFNMVNPLFIFHNTYTKYSNVIAGLDIEYKNPETQSEVYGSIALDNWSLKVENDKYPKQLAYLFGAQKFILGVKCGVEYARTSKWMYNHKNEYLKYTNRRHINVDYGKKADYYVDYPIGYYLGPDAEVLNFTIEYKKYKLDYRRVNKGEKNLRSDIFESDDLDDWYSLSGVIEKRDQIYLSYKIKSFHANIKYEKISDFANEAGRNEQIYSISFLYKLNKLFTY